MALIIFRFSEQPIHEMKKKVSLWNLIHGWDPEYSVIYDYYGRYDIIVI